VGVLAEKRLYIINNPATIDQDYRGEIKVILYNFSENSVNILIGDIIGRLSFNMIKKIQLQLYDAQN
jgi:dUTP pyrophosphatase